MKRITRDPEKFEVIDLFDAIGQKRDLKLHDESSEKIFLESIQTSLGRYKTPIILHGRRIEAMFGYVAASLGRSVVIKKEDCGEVFLESTDTKIPDYRAVTQSGEQFLVEVKNCHKSKPSAKFSLKVAYLDALKSYASLVNLELKIAIYWSRWNKWVLISPEGMRRERSTCMITFVDSYMQNQMSILGDVTIGTTPPLMFRLLTDPEKPRHVGKNSKATFTIGHVELYSAGQLIIEKEEKNIAFYLMLYGDWPTNQPKAHIEDGELIAIEYLAEPIEEMSGQEFEIIGSMSGMISRHYNELTAPSGQIERFAPKVEPGMLGIAIPANYKGSQLPLWRFIQQPAKDDDGGT